LTNLLAVVDDFSIWTALLTRLLIRDFLTSNDYLRLLLENLFTSLLKKARRAGNICGVAAAFVRNFEGIPLHSPLKKFCLPLLIPHTKVEIEVWGLLRDPNHHAYAARLCPRTPDFVRSILARAVCECNEMTELVSLNAVLRGCDVSAVLEFVHGIDSQFHRCWFILEMSIANSGAVNASDLREAQCQAFGGWNWDLRLLSLQSFVANFTADACDEFLAAVDSILLNDSEPYQSAVVACFDGLFHHDLPAPFVVAL
jgi:hypothetical protein